MKVDHMQVEAIYRSDFGAQLFNLFTMSQFPGKKELYFSARHQVVEAMIRAMLDEQAQHGERTHDFHE